MLIVLSGLPGVGKTTIARELAHALAAVHLRIDSIEHALRHTGLVVEAEGYAVAHAVAADNLRVGRTVVADSVNPWPLTRDEWREAGGDARFAYCACPEDSESWIGGHGRSPYEQKTQQSPVLGLSVLAHAGQSCTTTQRSVGMISCPRCPQYGQNSVEFRLAIELASGPFGLGGAHHGIPKPSLADCDESLPRHPIRRDKVNPLEIDLLEATENVRGK